jgi:hypothetical protein
VDVSCMNVQISSRANVVLGRSFVLVSDCGLST